MKVFVLDGDGSLLMNLGSLVTIANMAPPNLVHFLFQNGVYRISGGQPIPRANEISFTSFAAAAGYASVHQFEDLESLANNLGAITNGKGPTFICLKIVPCRQRPPFPLTWTASIISRFQAALRRTVSRTAR